MNHQAFADAALSPGDRLGIGPIELEVVSAGVGPTTVDLEQLPEEANHLGKPPHCNGGALGSGQDFSEGISRAEADSERELQRQNLENERRRVDELAASLQRRETSLAARAEHLDAQQTELETQRQASNSSNNSGAEQAETQKRLDEQRQILPRVWPTWRPNEMPGTRIAGSGKRNGPSWLSRLNNRPQRPNPSPMRNNRQGLRCRRRSSRRRPKGRRSIWPMCSAASAPK